MNRFSLLPGEQITFSLRALYDQYGYTRYKMNKFEEYDLYARNKDFLISDSVITFTDTSGKLMALKPDVTLSIIKNTRDISGTVQKLYYNENVYRVSKGSHSYREIPQVGLEAIGDVDSYTIAEVLTLAAESLACTERSCVLEISHMGILSEVMAYIGIPTGQYGRMLHLIGEKNLHEMKSMCEELGISPQNEALLRSLLALSGTPEAVLPTLGNLLSGIVEESLKENFGKIVTSLGTPAGTSLRIDFSAVGDPRYYNGFVFKGFAQGIPSSILSGGQYDTMMQKMKRKSGAIGFAVYLDLLEQYAPPASSADVDILLLYEETASLSHVQETAKALMAQGNRVLVMKNTPESLQYRAKKIIKDCEVAEHA